MRISSKSPAFSHSLTPPPPAFFPLPLTCTARDCCCLRSPVMLQSLSLSLSLTHTLSLSLLRYCNIFTVTRSPSCNRRGSRGGVGSLSLSPPLCLSLPLSVCVYGFVCVSVTGDRPQPLSPVIGRLNGLLSRPLTAPGGEISLFTYSYRGTKSDGGEKE